MVVKKLEINGFRNLNGFSAGFAAEKNLIFGANGSGKTSVIEALFLLGFGKSFLPVTRRELIRIGASGFYLGADVLAGAGQSRISACLEKSFCLQLDGERAPLVEVGRYLYPLFFSHFNYSQPLDYAPYFRKLVDRFVYGLSALYFHDVLRYNHALKQKNSLLKNLGRSIQNSGLNGWNALLAETGCRIIEKRMAFINRLNETIAARFGDGLRVDYRPALPSAPPYSALSILDDLGRVQAAEVQSRRALIGPQRDRFDAGLAGRRLSLFSSGEKKKYLLMIYMAYVELFRQTRGECPVFLIDDYDAAMDEKNLEFLMEHFPAMQVIATSVTASERFANCLELTKEN